MEMVLILVLLGMLSLLAVGLIISPFIFLGILIKSSSTKKNKRKKKPYCSPDVPANVHMSRFLMD